MSFNYSKLNDLQQTFPKEQQRQFILALYHAREGTEALIKPKLDSDMTVKTMNLKVYWSDRN